MMSVHDPIQATTDKRSIATEKQRRGGTILCIQADKGLAVTNEVASMRRTVSSDSAACGLLVVSRETPAGVPTEPLRRTCDTDIDESTAPSTNKAIVIVMTSRLNQTRLTDRHTALMEATFELFVLMDSSLLLTEGNILYGYMV